MLKTLSMVMRNQQRRGGAGKFVNDPVQKLLKRLQSYRPTNYLAGVLTHTRFDGLIVDAKAKAVLDQASSKFEIGEASFLEDIDAFFQSKHFTSMRMFEVRTPSKNVQEDDRVDLVILADKRNYLLVNRHLPLQTRED